jgi:glutamine synthetase type III
MSRQGNWLRIQSPADLQKAISRMLNKILMDEQPLVHAGQFASLANAWTNAHRVFLEEVELANIKTRLDILEGKA